MGGREEGGDGGDSDVAVEEFEGERVGGELLEEADGEGGGERLEFVGDEGGDGFGELDEVLVLVALLELFEVDVVFEFGEGFEELGEALSFGEVEPCRIILLRSPSFPLLAPLPPLPHHRILPDLHPPLHPLNQPLKLLPLLQPFQPPTNLLKHHLNPIHLKHIHKIPKPHKPHPIIHQTKSINKRTITKYP